MKIKHLISLALASLITVSLCGCDNKPQSSDISTDRSSLSTPPETDIKSYPVPEDATFLRGAAGDVIGLSEITEARNGENLVIPPSELTEDNFFSAKTDCAYYAMPLYPCLTDRESEYDADNLMFKDAPPTTCSDYIKVKKGDMIFGLTVTKAESEFTNYIKPGVVASTHLTLEGEITLTGNIRVVPGDEYGVSTGDILFIPSGNVRLPVVRFDKYDENGTVTRETGSIFIMDGGSSDSITYTNEFAGMFVLGNINSTSADVSGIPSDGSIIKVSAVFSGITMSSTADWLTNITAELVSINAAK